MTQPKCLLGLQPKCSEPSENWPCANPLVKLRLCKPPLMAPWSRWAAWLGWDCSQSLGDACAASCAPRQSVQLVSSLNHLGRVGLQLSLLHLPSASYGHLQVVHGPEACVVLPTACRAAPINHEIPSWPPQLMHPVLM